MVFCPSVSKLLPKPSCCELDYMSAMAYQINGNFTVVQQVVQDNNIKETSNLPIRPFHDDVIKWKHFPRYWPFVRGIHRSPVNSPHKGQWRVALVFSLICTWINGWVNNREAGDLRRHRAHYDVIVCIGSDRLASQWPVSHKAFPYHDFSSGNQFSMVLTIMEPLRPWHDGFLHI